jgi:hypothetical protein
MITKLVMSGWRGALGILKSDRGKEDNLCGCGRLMLAENNLVASTKYQAECPREWGLTGNLGSYELDKR